jgi:hypothetical protein
LAAVDRLVAHYAMVADPAALHTVWRTLLEGGWVPVVIGLAPDGELHVLGPSGTQSTQNLLSRALRLARSRS